MVKKEIIVHGLNPNKLKTILKDVLNLIIMTLLFSMLVAPVGSTNGSTLF
jgi:hypothetical protein